MLILQLCHGLIGVIMSLVCTCQDKLSRNFHQYDGSPKKSAQTVYVFRSSGATSSTLDRVSLITPSHYHHGSFDIL